MNSFEKELENLKQAVTVLESQRAVLGDSVVEPAVAGLRQQIAALQAQVREIYPTEEERRIVTILFADVVGSTSLAEKQDPEDWREVVSLLYQAIGSVVQSNSGRIVQYLGDGILALFGAERASERDPEFAIRAALEAQHAVATLKSRQPVQIRVGIHTGLVVIGEMGAQARKEYTATGDAMNVAARLQAAAPPGGVLISHDTYRYVRGVFDITPQPLLSLRGKSEPVQTYLVQRVKPRAFRNVTRGVSGMRTPTIGREKELEHLKAAYQQAFDRRQLVWAQVIGVPGLGKSRLLVEMADTLELRQERVRLLRGRAFDGETQQPFALVRRMWFDRFQIADDAPVTEAEARWEVQFSELSGPGREEEAHAAGLLVGLPFASSPYIGAMRQDPSQVKGRAFVASRTLVHSIRQEMPLVVFLDDMHWMDESSWEYFTQVFLVEEGKAEHGHGVFILGTTRPEWSPPQALLSHPGYISIHLSKLTQDASAELVRELLKRVENVPDEAVKLIIERSEGVPYYAEEIVNLFLDRGIIDTQQEPWRFRPERLRETPLPATLQHLLLTRLGSLREEERVALQRGSIFGRNFWTGGLDALGVPSGEKVLEQLQPRGFVDFQPESVFEGENEWGFHHNLLHNVAYESVLKRERVKLHKLAAAWLEEHARQAGRMNEYTGLLGLHAERAGDTTAAASWYLQAGQGAKEMGALGEARQLLDRALALLPEGEREQRWRVLLERSMVFSMLGEYEALRADNLALLDLARESNDDNKLAVANSHWGGYLEDTGEVHKAVPVLGTALEAARRAKNRKLEAKFLAIIAVSLTRTGNLVEAAAAAEKALESGRGCLEELDLAKVLINVTVFFTESGDIARAAQLITEAVEIYHRLGERFGESIGLSNLGYDYVILGLPELAKPALERSSQLAEGIGARRIKVYARLNLGLARLRSGELLEARQLLEETLQESIALGDSFAHAAGLSYLALALESSGNQPEAGRLFAEAKERFGQLGVPAYMNDAIAGQARCALAQNHLEEARQPAYQLWDTLSKVGSTGMEFPIAAYLTCARVFDALGEGELFRKAVETGVHELNLRAEKISDPDWRQSYLHNIPEHQEIVELMGG